MKRKFKLFATLASLCLSVALMAFGVYAATNVTYNVTSTVSFVAQVAGTFNYEVSGGELTEARTGSGHTLSGSELNSAVNDENKIVDPVGEVKFDLSRAGGNVITYYVTFSSSSESPSWVTASFAKLFDAAAASGNQMTVKVAQGVGADVAAAKDAAHGALASKTDLTALSQQQVAGTDGTAGSATDSYALCIEVTLVNATKQLTDANNALDVTLTVTSISA